MNNELFEKYQIFTEQTIFDLSQQVMHLEQKLNVFTNLLEISKYINQYIKDQNLFPLINDMLIGVFGAKYSTIYIKTEDEYVEATPRTFSFSSIEEEKRLILDHNEEEFIINSNTPIYATHNEEESVFSCLGVPIKVNNHILGFVLIQHKEKDYFSKDHATFLSSLANHVGVAIENNLLYNQIKESAYKDGLTDIFNKRYFFDTLDGISNLTEQNYSIVMMDVDNFKRVNDTYGHPYGDVVLKTIASIIKGATRPNDIVARYGGEEIIIFFYNFTDRTKVFQRVDTMRKEIESTIIEAEDISSSVTASFGVYVKMNEKISLNEAIKRADDNLYICKRTGKNKVVIND
jgi:diguanylate cyclase (GGDEF)-like protein